MKLRNFTREKTTIKTLQKTYHITAMGFYEGRRLNWKVNKNINWSSIT